MARIDPVDFKPLNVAVYRSPHRKGCKISPFRAHGDSDTAVQMEVTVLDVGTSLDHAAPHGVEARAVLPTALPMLKDHSGERCDFRTPARSRIANQFCNTNASCCTALAAAFVESDVVNRVGRLSNFFVRPRDDMPKPNVDAEVDVSCFHNRIVAMWIKTATKGVDQDGNRTALTLDAAG